MHFKSQSITVLHFYSILFLDTHLSVENSSPCFIGNIVSEIPSGILVQKYGAKFIMVMGTILPAIVVVKL